MTHQKIIHLIDDTTAGGVTRAVEFLVTHPLVSKTATHLTVQTRKGALSATSYDADVIVSHTTLSWRGLAGLISLRAKNPNARLIHVEHSYTRGFAQESVRHKHRFLAMLRLGYALFDSVVAVSETQRDWLLECGLARAQTLNVIQPMVDVTPFERIAQSKAPQKTIGAIGRLERQKGFDVLIEGFRCWHDPDARLFIFGEGSQRKALEDLARGDARIVFKGHTADPAEAMRQVSVVAMPSRWEAYGLVALEAQAAGRSVLCHDVDGLSDAARAIAYRTDQNTAPGWALLLEQFCTAHDSVGEPATNDVHMLQAQWSRKWINLLSRAPSSAQDRAGADRVAGIATLADQH